LIREVERPREFGAGHRRRTECVRYRSYHDAEPLLSARPIGGGSDRSGVRRSYSMRISRQRCCSAPRVRSLAGC